MFNRIPVLLALIGAVIVALVSAYGFVLYSTAVEADASQDSRNKVFIHEELESHRVEIRKVLETLAVSEALFSAAQNNESAILAKLLCEDTVTNGQFSTIGVMSFTGEALFLCESGSVKKPVENDYVFEQPRQFFGAALNDFILEQNSYHLVLPEFHYTELYTTVAERQYLISAAISAPEMKRAMTGNYKPLIVFGYASLRNTLKDTELRLGISDLHMKHIIASDQADNDSAFGGANHGVPVAVGWDLSRAFRDQLLKASVPIILPSMSVLLLIGYFLTRIERLRLKLLANENAMRHLALHDNLTGLPNRPHFHKLLEEAVADSSKGKPGYVAVFDLDAFKSVNDCYGHDVGDMLLQETARRAVASLGPHNLVARLGGDEFTVILKSASDDKDALRVLSEMGATIGEAIRFGNIELHPNVSIGAARISSNTQKIAELIKNADIAMYEVKSNGKGHCRLFAA